MVHRSGRLNAFVSILAAVAASLFPHGAKAAPVCSADDPTDGPVVEQSFPATVATVAGAMGSATWVDVGSPVVIQVSDGVFESAALMEDVAVQVSWGKLGTSAQPGDCAASLPASSGPAGHEQTRIRIVFDDGTQRIRNLVKDNDYSGIAPHTSFVTNTFSDKAAADVSPFPEEEFPLTSGEFRPNSGNLLRPIENPLSASYRGFAPFGTWRLQAQTTNNEAPLCVSAWTVNIAVRQPVADVNTSIEATPSDTVDEGTPLDLDMGCSAYDNSLDDDAESITKYEFDCDNSSAPPPYNDNLAVSTAQCTYADEGTSGTGSGTYTIQIRVTDNQSWQDTDTRTITVNNADPVTQAPLPGVNAYTHQPYYECFDVVDPGADNLTFSLLTPPGGMSLIPTSDPDYYLNIGVPTSGGSCVSWTPQCSDVTGSKDLDDQSEQHFYSLSVDDGDTGNDTDQVSLVAYDGEFRDLDIYSDCYDNCPFADQVDQADHDGDDFDLDAYILDNTSQDLFGGDICDGDTDNDGLTNGFDNCDPNTPSDTDPDFGGEPDSEIGLLPTGGFHSNANDDWDGDGCKDNDTVLPNEDVDDDNDGVTDSGDLCDPDANPDDITGDGQTNGVFFSANAWTSSGGPAGTATDYDGDGCQDYAGAFSADLAGEDDDDDNDGVPDAQDLCDPDDAPGSDAGPAGAVTTVHTTGGFATTGPFNGVIPVGPFVDYDQDGCEDGSEDHDDDNDGRLDSADDCDPDSSADDLPAVPPGAPPSAGTDSSQTNWNSNTFENDHDADGCKDDQTEDGDDDNDGVADGADKCDPDDLPGDGHDDNALGYPDFVTAGASDYDGDGCVDDDVTNAGNCVGTCPAEDGDDDNDGALDGADECDPDLGDDSPDFNSELNWTSSQSGDPNNTGTDWDDDGCKDTDGDDANADDEDDDDDNDGALDGSDDCDPSGYSSQGQLSNPVVYTSEIGWDSSQVAPDLDYDSDGCKDEDGADGDADDEDNDDDNDRQLDTADDCDPDDEARTIHDGTAEGSDTSSNMGWNSDTAGTDHDDDGCQDGDDTEDFDDDNDRSDDASDDCDPTGFDGMGLWNPAVTNSAVTWNSSSTSEDYDQDGCQDSGEDTDDDDDIRTDGADACDGGTLPAISSELHWTSQLPHGCTVQQDGANTYLACTALMSWQHARNVCQGLGGDLVNIVDSTENTYVTGISGNAWTGGADLGADGQWRWADNDVLFWNGSTLTYANWNAGEPNGGASENCLNIWNDGTWNDLSCSALLPFICELPVPPTEQDYDDDGCKDEDGADANTDDEDEDDDLDLVADGTDLCDPDSGINTDTGLDNDTGPAGASHAVAAHPVGYYASVVGTLSADHDVDGCQDGDEDPDDDNDGRLDAADDCDPDDETRTLYDGTNEPASPASEIAWDANVDELPTNGYPDLDHDGDGCRDLNEDTDDDNDRRGDTTDSCDPDGWLVAQTNAQDDPGVTAEAEILWNSTSTSEDYDSDGCKDEDGADVNVTDEDDDDDNDRRADGSDDCDPDNENDIVADLFSMADENTLASIKGFDSQDDAVDHDGDGCLDDNSEDNNNDNDRYLDGSDRCESGVVAWTGGDYDNDGCEDYIGGNVAPDNVSEDTDLDNDGVGNDIDRCDPADLLPAGPLTGSPTADTDLDSQREEDGFVSNVLTSDRDGDGCRDENGTEEDSDDDNDGVADNLDNCDPDDLDPVSTDHGVDLTSDTGWLSSLGVGTQYSNAPGTDWDNDGCRDAGEDDDDDADGRKDDITPSPSDLDGDRCDPDDSVPAGDTGIVASLRDPGGTDVDQDGCREPQEDLDGDNDGKLDASGDQCVGGYIGTCVDYDNDGCCDVVGGPQDNDDDNDGINDSIDACDPSSGFPASSQGDYTDYDSDGCEDGVEDNDDDNDTVLNPADDCDNSALGFISDKGTGTPGNDYNGDGCRDSDEDGDDDNDLVNDGVDRCDPDNDSLPDVGILSSVKGTGGDYDGDGCKDANIDADPDDDNDNVADATDLCDPDNNDVGPMGAVVPGDSGANPQLGSYSSVIGALGTDADGDGCQDSGEDLDDDGDGKPDGSDNCPNLFNPTQTDVLPPPDGDGIGDLCAGDDDGDTVPNAEDNCPLLANANQADLDGDNLGDVCDPDVDGDGVNDVDDNCPLDQNAPADETVDMDGDGEGDVCDLDRDGDGLLNDDEDDTAGPLAGLDSSDPDTDGDGIDDGTEVGDDLLPDNPGVQPDGDGLIDEPLNPRNTDLEFTNGDDVIDALEGPDGTNNGDEDSDADGFLDIDEAGDPGVDDPFPRDTNADGEPDYRDVDSDGDGFDDGADDNCDLIANDQTNTDVLLGNNPDGLGDACDDDIDGDTLTNTDEGDLETNPLLPDSDGDGIDDPTEVGPNVSQPYTSDGKGNAEDGIDANDMDSDDDGISDAIEAGDPEGDPFPANTDGTDLPDYRDNDSDNDGIGDVADNCRVVQNQNQTNSDASFLNGDLLGNACDTDDDNDGVLDTGDNCPIGPTQNASQTDTDGDATTPGPFPGNGGDVCDPDDDNDGDPDTGDNCPLTSNSNQRDQDEDGTGDACDNDLDGDGDLNAADNCPLLANADQLDSDGDSTTPGPFPGNGGDVCDANDDLDALVDTLDNCPTVTNENQANFDNDSLGDVCDPDDDNDLVPDSTDTCDTNNSSDQTDTDEDGLGNPCDPDDDNDEDLDGADNCPLDANGNQADNDDDGDGDACDSNDDNDALADSKDNCPNDVNDNQADNDDDGAGDVCDDDDDDDGVDDGDDNCPLDANRNQANADGDDDGDVCDDDDDNDGIPDDSEEEDAGVEPQQDAGPSAGSGGRSGSGGTGGAAGGAAGTGSPDAGPGAVACEVDAIAAAASFEVPEVVNRETIAAALVEAGFELPEQEPTIADIENALRERGIILVSDCDLAVLLGEIKKRAVDDGCGCSTVGAPSEYGGARAALLGGLALALGYRRRRRAA